MRLDPHEIRLDPDEGENVVTVFPASQESVNTVLAAGEDDPEGRSQWMWVRLGNGDLILGVYPQGETYFATEKDAVGP